PSNPVDAEAALKQVRGAAQAMGLQIRALNASNSTEINEAFGALAHDLPDALFVAGDPMFVARRVQVTHLATRYAIPAAYSSRVHVDAGGLRSYGANVPDAWRQAGVYTGRILKGVKPADLPVVQSTKVELVINHQTARMLGLTVPPTLLATADEVIE